MSNVVVISAVHDYRMPRRGSVQAIADAFVRRGCATAFVSVRFSELSKVRNDPRWFLASEANAVRNHNGVDCYLWRTPLHPFRARPAWLNWLTAPLHDVYAHLPNEGLDQLLRAADVVLVESGLGILLIPRIRRLNRSALLIYRASDSLDTIGAHPLLQRRLQETASFVDQYCLLAEAMAPPFRFARARTFVVPQGIQASDFEEIGDCPYEKHGNAVCVGSMLFDPSYFDVAAAAFPEITFHVIGSGRTDISGANVVTYDEMPFRETLPYIAHADFGVAPYRSAPGASYLSESSLKLTQFAYLRRPSVCPHFAVGGRAHRFGYTPGDAAEIQAATAAALRYRFRVAERRPMNWDELVPRLLRPGNFPDTYIPSDRFEAA